MTNRDGEANEDLDRQSSEKTMPPIHWHKLPIRQFIKHEIKRDGFMPFFIGMG